MRTSTGYILFNASCLLIIAALIIHAQISSSGAEPARRYRSDLVQKLQLTDLALFTEARYTRHLSMADNHSAFQDHPVSLEHFPSGALTRPRTYR